MPEPEPTLPGDGRFPEDPEFNIGTDADEAAVAMRNIAKMLAAYRDQLGAEGFTDEQVIGLVLTASAALIGRASS